MKTAEAMAVEKGSSYLELMENAGHALTEEVLKRRPYVSGKSVLVLCGSGNNGGDGFVAARLLAQRGARVTVFTVMKDRSPKGIALEAFERLKEFDNIKITADFPEGEYYIVIDAVFGTGFHGELDESISRIFERVNRMDCFRAAADIPSGADSVTGKISPNTFNAHLTVTFGAVKVGMTISPAKKCCGEIVCAEIGIDSKCFEKTPYSPIVMDNSIAAAALPERNEHSHKGCFGKLLIIGGSSSMSGAAAMNVRGALRSGAGLIKLASVKSVIDRVGANLYECTFAELTENNGGISSESIPQLISLTDGMTAVAIGSGMGLTKDTALITKALIAHCGEKNIPLIIDADGLNAIEGSIDIIRNAKCRAVLTPHPKELSRLLGKPLEYVMNNRLAAAAELSELTGAIVAAKGFPTFIVSPEKKAAASYTGNGGLSRGGSGDVLTGIISGMICSNRGERLFESVCAGVYVFGLAADIAAAELSMTGMLPTDAADRLPSAFQILEKQMEHS